MRGLAATGDDQPSLRSPWLAAEEGFHVENSLNRFAIGDWDELKFDDDGSLDIYLQHESPGKDKEPNWLPNPAKGNLGITMRLYAPKQQVLDGEWKPPYIVETE